MTHLIGFWLHLLVKAEMKEVSIMRAIPSLCLAVLVSLSSLLFAQAPGAIFHSFDFPGATDTEATGITPGGQIVGRYYNPDGSHHGFLFFAGFFSSIDFPGADLTDAQYINDRGVIVGYYVVNQIQHGFRLQEGQFTTVDHPGFLNTVAAGIGSDEDADDIVGGVSNNYGTDFQGFLLRHGKFSPIVFPGATVTFQEATGVEAGRIVGGYFDAAGGHGYVLAEGKYQSIDCPNAPGGVFLSAIDFFGRVAGEMTTADGHSHGLVVTDGACMAVDFPGSIATYVNSIDTFGDAAGRYTDPLGHTHGFFARHLLPPGFVPQPFNKLP